MELSTIDTAETQNEQYMTSSQASQCLLSDEKSQPETEEVSPLMRKLLSLKKERDVSKDKDKTKINELLTPNTVNTSHPNKYYEGQTALHIAIERRSEYFVCKLLENGAEVHVNACGKFFQLNNENGFYFGELPLSLAACTNQPDMVKLLLEKRADPKQKDSHGNTVLHALVMVASEHDDKDEDEDKDKDNTEIITAMYDLVLTLCHDLQLEDEKNNEKLTPLKLAAKTGKVKLLKHLLQREFRDKKTRHLSHKFTEWDYGPITGAIYDLTSIDTRDDDNSVLKIVVYETDFSKRLKMLELEPLKSLLKEKWEELTRKMFLIQFVAYLLYLTIFTVLAFYSKIHLVWDKTSGVQIEFTTSAGSILYILGMVFTMIASIYFCFKGITYLLRKHPLQTFIIEGYYYALFFFQGLLYLISAILYFCGVLEYLGFQVSSLVISWINLIYFFRGTKLMGIYSVMIMNMIVIDIIPFICIYITFFFGFSLVLTAILVTESTLTNLSPQSSSVDTSGDLTDPSSIPLELFKITVGLGDLDFMNKFNNKYLALVMVIIYIITTYILLFNMLIALMCKTVEKTFMKSKSIWRLQRAFTTLDIEAFWQSIYFKVSGKEKTYSMVEDDATLNLPNYNPDKKRWLFRTNEAAWNTMPDPKNSKVLTQSTDMASAQSSQGFTMDAGD